MVSLVALPMMLVSGLVPLSAQAALSPVVGLTDPAIGFPSYYADTNGLAIAPCLDGLPLCVTTRDEWLGSGADGEGFYYAAGADVGNLSTSLVIEGVYVDAGPGQEATFARSQYSAQSPNSLEPNKTYTITDPYGTNTCTTTDAGTIPNSPQTGCRFETGGVAPLDFATTTTGRIGPFLTWDTFGAAVGAPPAGYIGDNVTPHAVTGSPTGFNMVRVEGPGINLTPLVDKCLTVPGAFADCDETSLFTISGKVAPTGPAASTNVSALDFGNVAGTPPSQNITYTSFGSANAIVSSVALSGPGAADFTLTDGCTVAVGIPSGSNCPIAVAFTPRAGVVSSASLTINDNTLGTGRVVSLTGSSLPVTTLDRISMSFPNQKTGTTGASERVTVGNSGVSPLTVTPTLTGIGASHFKIASNLCTAAVDPGRGCEIAVSFAPTTSGLKTATLVVTDNTGKASTVALSGTGTTASISVSPTSVAFANTNTGGVSSGNVTVTNGGSAPAFISSISGSGDFAYAATSSTCTVGMNLAAGSACHTDVSFRPTAAGARTGTLAMNIDGVTSSVPLSGNGITVVLPAARFAGAPTLGAITRGNTRAFVRWGAPASNGGSVITGYSVRVTNASTGVQIGGLRTAAATARGLTVSGLVNGRAVKFRVRARNRMGLGANSALSRAVTPARTASAPRIRTASSGAPRGIVTAVARWAAPTSNGGSAVNGYYVTALRLNSRGAVVSQVRSAVIAPTRRYVTLRLRAGNYRFVVQARNAMGLSAKSAKSNRVTAR